MNWTEDDNVVTFSLDVNYTLDREQSWADPKDIHVTTINIPLIVSISMLLGSYIILPCSLCLLAGGFRGDHRHGEQPRHPRVEEGAPNGAG